MEDPNRKQEVKAVCRDITGIQHFLAPCCVAKLSACGIQGKLHSWPANFHHSHNPHVALDLILIFSLCGGWSVARHCHGSKFVPHIHW